MIEALCFTNTISRFVVDFSACFGVRVSVTFHLMRGNIIFSSI